MQISLVLSQNELDLEGRASRPPTGKEARVSIQKIYLKDFTAAVSSSFTSNTV
jgi:hypothetical protein